MTGQVHTTTKKELVNRIAESSGLTKVVVKEVVQQFLDEIIGELAKGNRLEFREFGVFEVKERAARRAQNPRTLEKVDVPAKRVVKFKVGRTMRDQVCDEPQPNSAQKSAPKPSSAQASSGGAGAPSDGADAGREAPASKNGSQPTPPPSNSPF